MELLVDCQRSIEGAREAALTLRAQGLGRPGADYACPICLMTFETREIRYFNGREVLPGHLRSTVTYERDDRAFDL